MKNLDDQLELNVRVESTGAWKVQFVGHEQDRLAGQDKLKFLARGGLFGEPFLATQKRFEKRYI